MAPRPPKRQKTSSSSSSLPDSINHFTLLPIGLPATSSKVPTATHILYIKKQEEPETPRTIFVVNVPIDSTKEKLRGLFDSLGGRPEDVCFHSQTFTATESLPDVWDRRLNASGSTAVITFPTQQEVERVFKTISTERQKRDGPIREWGIGVDKSHSSLGLQRTSLFVLSSGLTT